MRLEVLLSIRRTLGHQKYTFRPTKYNSIKFAKNEIFPKDRGGEKISNISKNLNIPKCARSVFKHLPDLRTPKICI